MSAHFRRKTPERKKPGRRAARAEEAPPVPTLDPVQLDQFRRELKQAWQAVTATYPLRLDTPQAWEEWKAAVHQQWELRHGKYAELYFRPQPLSEEAARYTWDFWRDVELLRGGDHTKLEAVVSFLEADPWFHGSGYAKVKMVRYIKLPMLTPDFTERLQNVVLAMVERRNGQEFRAFCRLACKVDAPALREQLTRRLTDGDPDTRRRARWVLEALGQNQPKEKRP